MYKVILLLLCAIIMLPFTACKKVKIDGDTASTPSVSQSNVQSNTSTGDDNNKIATSSIKVENNDIISSVVSSNDAIENSKPDLENSALDDNISSDLSDTDNNSQEDISSDDIGVTSEPFSGEEDEFDPNY